MSVGSLSAPSTERGRLQRAVLEVLYEHEANGELPTNGRFLFYELEQRGVVSKVRRGARRADQDLTDALMYVRERGLIPWSWIVDETRAVYGWDRADNMADAVAEAIAEAETNPWDGPAPLLLVESRSLGGVLRGLANEHRCRLAPTNGQAGGFLRTELAPLLVGNDRRVLYLGDLDHQGGQIEDNSRRVLERVTGRLIDWRRVAITPEQVAQRDLTPILKKDNRYRPAREQEAWETEALGQRTVMDLVRGELERLLPRTLTDVTERERWEREHLLRTLAQGGDPS